MYFANYPIYHLEFIPLIYSTLGLLYTSVFFVTGLVIVRPYVTFLCLLMVAVFSTNILRVLFGQFIRNFGGVCLLCFLFYYLVMAIGYPDTQIGSWHISHIMGNVTGGFLAGFVSFGNIKMLPFHALSRRSQSIRSIFLNIPSIASLLFCFMSIIFTLLIFWSIKRTDVFLIHFFAGLDDVTYQTYGGFALLLFIGAMIIIMNFYHNQKNIYFIRYFLMMCFLGILIIINLTLVGSNKEIIAVVLILLMYIIYKKPKKYFYNQQKIRIKAFYVLLIILLFCGVVWFYLLAFDLPPLRVFNFNEHASIIENEGFLERIKIIKTTGLAQFSISPIWGNIGAQYLVDGGGPGRYIHSLVSVQTHLGIIGTLFLMGYLIHRLYRLYANVGRSALKIITPPILFISFISTFFTWIVFWYLIGALFVPRKDL